MLYWLFTTYRQQVAIYVTIPLLITGVVLPIIAAFTLGKPGRKVARPALAVEGAEQPQLIVALGLLQADKLPRIAKVG